MNQPIQPRNSVLATLRALVPNRSLRYGEALRITELQANRLRRELGVTSPELPENSIGGIGRVRVIEIDHLPSSGVSHWHNGTWIIAVDRSEPWQRKRFTVAHELSHVINYPTENWLNASDHFRSQSRKRELLADYFAGCLLMPKQHIKRLAGEGFSPSDLADIFGVSERAVEVRLSQLGVNPPRGRCLTSSNTFVVEWRYACVPPETKEVAA